MRTGHGGGGAHGLRRRLPRPRCADAARGQRGPGRIRRRRSRPARWRCPTSSTYGLPDPQGDLPAVPGRVPALPAIDWGACTRCGALRRGGRRPGHRPGRGPIDRWHRGGRDRRRDRLRPLPAVPGRVRLRRVGPGRHPPAAPPDAGPRGSDRRATCRWTGGRRARSRSSTASAAARSRAWTSPGRAASLNEYCSRVCCTATLQAANELRERYPGDGRGRFLPRHPHLRQKDQEDYYEDASKKGVLFFRFDTEEPPDGEVAPARRTYPAARAGCSDTLTFGQEIEVPVDLVVLAVGMDAHATWRVWST